MRREPVGSLLVGEKGGVIMKWCIIVILLVAVLGLSFSQTELSVLKYQLQMPAIVGNAAGFRLVGTLQEGAFGIVFKYDKGVMITGQVLGYNSVIGKWLETGVIEWRKIYFDIFFIFRF